MSDDELDRELRAARPHTAADDGWAGSPDGDRALAAIRGAVSAPSSTVSRLRRVRPFTLVAGLAAAAAAVVVVSLTASGSNGGSHPIARPPVSTPPGSTPPGVTGPAPAAMSLVAYDSCGAMLDGLRAHTAKAVTAYGLGGGSVRYGLDAGVNKATVPSAVSAEGSAADPSTPDHSTTNVQEAGVGEPDTVETDGRRVVSVSGGVLRVVDASTHQVTGRLDLTVYAGASSAQLLMSGDRVLVILGQPVPYYRGLVYGPYQPQTTISTFLLVDLSAAPTIVGTLHPQGGYVDARMVDGTARLVVQSTPKLAFPTPAGNESDRQRLQRNRTVVAHAPLSAWLPTYDVSVGLRTSRHTVDCGRVSHPATYTGTSMLTVYTVDLTAGLGDPVPVTLAADGTAVYASPSSLYVASADGAHTQLHRFDITGPARPIYLGSGKVPGGLLDSYSMSEYAGSLRVVTTTYPNYSGDPDTSSAPSSTTAVYTLDADTLKKQGQVGGLGVNEQVHGVRFLGPLAYVVTFRSVDPLYVLDLHDPTHPRRAGELTVTGYSDYLHPVAAGRLLGVGEHVDGSGIVTGLQLSLFDVATPAHPTRLARLTQSHSPSETPIDPHAFLYWPAEKLAVVPIDSWNPDESGAALVVRVGDRTLATVGTIRNPAVSGTDGYDSGIQRTLVIGNDIWTMSTSGLRVSDLHSLAEQAWVPFD